MGERHDQILSGNMVSFLSFMIVNYAKFDSNRSIFSDIYQIMQHKSLF